MRRKGHRERMGQASAASARNKKEAAKAHYPYVRDHNTMPK
jgi:hypothetical protein